MLALTFLIVIGCTLVMEGAGAEVNKSYVYCCIAFAIALEVLNQAKVLKTNKKKTIKVRKRQING